MDNPWIEGPALDIVLSLRAVQKGDEVKVRLHDYLRERGSTSKYSWAGAEIAEGEVVHAEHRDDSLPYQIRIPGTQYEQWGLSNYIVAWRRPT